MKELINNIHFAYPYLLFLLIFIPFIVYWYIYKINKKIPKLRTSNLSWFEKSKHISLRQRFFHLPFILKCIGLIFLIIAIARPQSKSKRIETEREGIDIVLTMDISGSMEAMDLKPNRLEASKELAIDFIKKRPDDRIGLVVFGSEAFTHCPLTTDHKILIKLFDYIGKNELLEKQTAIGDGLATAINRIKDSEAISKVIILLTDGVQNAGAIDPMTAVEIAKVYGIRIYTIGVGTKGKAPMKISGLFGTTTQLVDVEIDEETLKAVSENTNAKYFRATNNKELEEIYNTIDKLEKSKIDEYVFENKHDEYLKYAIIALVFLFLDAFLRLTIFRTKP